MGCSFRKSVNLGPLRVNLSKSGVGPVGVFRAFVSVLLLMVVNICELVFQGRCCVGRRIFEILETDYLAYAFYLRLDRV
jgi:hypothetical protein